MTRVLVSISAVLSVILLSLIYNALPIGTPASRAAVASATIAPPGALTSSMAGMEGMTGSSGFASVAAPVARLNLTIVTGGMTGHDEFPAFIPSDFTLPANSTVLITITNFDDATALPKGSEQYATVSGTVGNAARITPIKAGDPNGSGGPTRVVTALDPANVSHTFTIPALGINVPIAPRARETFVLHTGAPGHYLWRCFDPCGADPMGWGTAMGAKSGFMQGTLTVE
jgi:hypothetical protein